MTNVTVEQLEDGRFRVKMNIARYYDLLLLY